MFKLSFFSLFVVAFTVLLTNFELVFSAPMKQFLSAWTPKSLFGFPLKNQTNLYQSTNARPRLQRAVPIRDSKHLPTLEQLEIFDRLSNLVQLQNTVVLEQEWNSNSVHGDSQTTFEMDLGRLSSSKKSPSLSDSLRGRSGSDKSGPERIKGESDTQSERSRAEAVTQSDESGPSRVEPVTQSDESDTMKIEPMTPSEASTPSRRYSSDRESLRDFGDLSKQGLSRYSSGESHGSYNLPSLSFWHGFQDFKAEDLGSTSMWNDVTKQKPPNKKLSIIRESDLISKSNSKELE